MSSVRSAREAKRKAGGALLSDRRATPAGLEARLNLGRGKESQIRPSSLGLCSSKTIDYVDDNSSLKRLTIDLGMRPETGRFNSLSPIRERSIRGMALLSTKWLPSS